MASSYCAFYINNQQIESSICYGKPSGTLWANSNTGKYIIDVNGLKYFCESGASIKEHIESNNKNDVVLGYTVVQYKVNGNQIDLTQVSKSRFLPVLQSSQLFASLSSYVVSTTTTINNSEQTLYSLYFIPTIKPAFQSGTVITKDNISSFIEALSNFYSRHLSSIYGLSSISYLTSTNSSKAYITEPIQGDAFSGIAQYESYIGTNIQEAFNQALMIYPSLPKSLQYLSSAQYQPIMATGFTDFSIAEVLGNSSVSINSTKYSTVDYNASNLTAFLTMNNGSTNASYTNLSGSAQLTKTGCQGNCLGQITKFCSSCSKGCVTTCKDACLQSCGNSCTATCQSYCSSNCTSCTGTCNNTCVTEAATSTNNE